MAKAQSSSGRCNMKNKSLKLELTASSTSFGDMHYIAYCYALFRVDQLAKSEASDRRSGGKKIKSFKSHKNTNKR